MMAATPLEELSTYKKKREAMRAFLDALYEMGGEVHSDRIAVEGKDARAGYVNATTVVLQHVDPIHHANSADTWNKLRAGGWIDAPINGKRVASVKMAIGLPWKNPRWPKTDTDETPTGTTQATGPTAEDVPTPQVEPVVPAPGDDMDAELLGIRPGRLAARLEQSVPLSVTEAVMAAFKADRDAQYQALGYYPTIPQAELDELTQIVEQHSSREALMQTRISDLQQELVILGYAYDTLAAADDERLVRTNEGTPAMKGSLSVEKVPDPYKALARLALQQGWTIKKTRGNHLAWRSPEGKTAFSGSTPSDVNSHYIMRRKLRNKGLVVGGGTTELADVDRFAVGSMDTSE